MNGRKCVFFDGDRLCGLYRTTGEMCEICRKYPRFFEEYDGFSEAGLSVSCPVAAEMILKSDERDYEKIGSRPAEERLLAFLVRAREQAFSTVFDRRFGADEAAERLVGLACSWQEMIDFDELEYVADADDRPVCAFSDGEFERAVDFIISETEPLCDRREERLRTARSGGITSGSETERRGCLGYLVYRYFLKAVGSEDLLTQCRFIVLMYRLAKTCGENFAENAMFLSREIEHCPESVEKLAEILAG